MKLKIICVSLIGFLAVISIEIFAYPCRDDFISKGRDKEWVINSSELIVYVEILEVNKSVKEEAIYSKHGPLFPEQSAQVKFLKILKGTERLENSVNQVRKQESHFSLYNGERLVLYLRKEGDKSFRTIGTFRGHRRLASAIADINTIKKQRAGLVIGIIGNKKLEDIEINILEGRYKAPVVLETSTYEKGLVKTAKPGEFGIATISLEPGKYTVLFKTDDRLEGFSRLINGHYPYVILQKSNWRGLYFDIRRQE